MRRSIRIVPAVLLVLAAACTNAKLGAPSPDGIVVSVNAPTVVAGDNNLVVRAQVFEKGVVLLGQSVTFTVGTTTQTATTSSSTGFAISSFSLHTAGAVKASAAVVGPNGQISDSTDVNVIAADPASLAVTIPSQTVTADTATLNFTATAKDAFQNVTTAPVQVSADSPGAAVQGSTVLNLHTAGTFVLHGTVAGFPAVTGSAGFIVSPGAATQVIGNIGQSVVGKLQTLSFNCDEKDGWGNSTGATFAATTNASTTPASTITALGGNHFTASGFTGAGVYTANCSQGALTDAKTFQVVPQNATNSVVASLDNTLINAGTGTTTLTCTEVDGFGTPVAATLTASLTDPTSNTTALGGSSPYAIGSLTATGLYTATCTDAGASLSDSKSFGVIDGTPPTVVTTVSAATGNGVQADKKYAPNTSLTIHLHVTDNVRIVTEAISVSGSATVVGSATHTETTTTADTTVNFTVKVNAGAATFSTFTVQTSATDGAGNIGTGTPLTFTVDPAEAGTVGTGVVARTVFEEPFTASVAPVALASSGGNLYLTTQDAANEATTVFFPASGAGTASTLFFTGWVLGADIPVRGLVWVPGGFGPAGDQLFEPDQGGGGQIITFNPGPVSLTDDPSVPTDLTYGALGTTTALIDIETAAAPNRINFLTGAGTGVTTTFFIDTAGRLATAGLVVDSNHNLLIPASGATGDVMVIDGTTAQLNLTPFFTAPAAVDDIAIGTSSKILALTAGASGSLERYDSAGGSHLTAFSISHPLLQITVDAAGTAYLLASDGATFNRVYKVTGY